ncbi:nickel ABC transporter permease subunit NikB [Eubacterium sp. An11]|uniref:ABC transporter permease n=1 Tax=Eubacterium sp. An11 TaxID=1965542 RepID=UPI000B370129|nr:ABC transporter permease [Eubacterium sp. An11]OUQ69251.1 nickel ABC transporter permease subunit NikB [Eubacterium sp. An11]
MRRLLHFVFVLFGITFLSFALIHMAGSDAVLQQMDVTGVALSREAMEAQREALGLDRPFLVQYADWLRGCLRGDFGVSFLSGDDVLSVFLSKLPATLLLAGISLFLTILISVPLGIYAAVRQNRISDWLIRAGSFLGNSLPNFFVALLLLYVFAIRLSVFPVISEGASGVVLPSVTLAAAMSAKYVRQVRAAVLEEMTRDYVTGAKARGVSFSMILFKNVLPSCLPALLTMLTLSAGSLLGGTAVVESIFMWDGVGKLAVDAIFMRDYPMIQAYVLWMALIYMLLNLAADISYGRLDPRIRLNEKENAFQKKRMSP